MQAIDWGAIGAYLLANLGYVVTALGVVAGVIGAILRWPFFRSHARLARERDAALAERDNAIIEMQKSRATTLAAKQSTDLILSILDELRTQVETLDAKVERMEEVQVVAFRYIVDLISQHPSDMPPIPPEIGDAVREALHARSEALRVVAQRSEDAATAGDVATA